MLFFMCTNLRTHTGACMGVHMMHAPCIHLSTALHTDHMRTYPHRYDHIHYRIASHAHRLPHLGAYDKCAGGRAARGAAARLQTLPTRASGHAALRASHTRRPRANAVPVAQIVATDHLRRHALGPSTGGAGSAGLEPRAGPAAHPWLAAHEGRHRVKGHEEAQGGPGKDRARAVGTARGQTHRSKRPIVLNELIEKKPANRDSMGGVRSILGGTLDQGWWRAQDRVWAVDGRGKKGHGEPRRDRAWLWVDDGLQQSGLPIKNRKPIPNASGLPCQMAHVMGGREPMGVHAGPWGWGQPLAHRIQG